MKAENIRTGKLKANGFIVGELSFDRTSGDGKLTVNFALANVDSDGIPAFYGKATKSLGWSEETQKQLAALLTSIETDLSQDLFEGSTEPVSNGESTLPVDENGIPGL